MHRHLRALCLANQLPPDTAPEDILLLARDDKGILLTTHEYQRCTRWLAEEERHP